MPHKDKMHTLKKPMPMADMPMDSMLPSFSLTSKDLPEIKNWKVGGKYKIEMEVEQVSMSKDEYMEGEPLSARFTIHKIKSDSHTEEEKEGMKGHY